MDKYFFLWFISFSNYEIIKYFVEICILIDIYKYGWEWFGCFNVDLCICILNYLFERVFVNKVKKIINL